MSSRSRTLFFASLIPLLAAIGCNQFQQPASVEPPAETYTAATYQMATDTAPAAPIDGAKVTTDFFEKAHVTALLGRTFQKSDVSGGSDVVVISESLWKERFGGDRGILGTLIRLDSKPFVIIGVMRPGYTFPKNARLWTPRRAGG